MGISVLDFPVDSSIRTEDWQPDKYPIAVGDDCIYLLKHIKNPRIIKVDLANQTTLVSNMIGSALGYAGEVAVWPFRNGRKRNGDLFMDCLVMDYSETAGSRNLYLRRIYVDPTDLTISADTQRTLTGSADLTAGTVGLRILKYGETLIWTVFKETKEDYAIKIDLHGMRYQTVEIDTSTNDWSDNWRHFCDLLVDRTTNKLYILSAVYYWLPGSYKVMEIVDPCTLTQVAYTTDYDSGCGDVCVRRYYRDSVGKVRYYHVGNSGAVTYTSHFGTFYADNDALVVETEVTIDDTYKDYSCGNTAPIPLGITSDNKIAWLLIGGSAARNDQPSSGYTSGFQLITTNDTFGSPTKITSATYSVTTSDYRAGDKRPYIYLREADWCYYAPDEILASSPQDKWKWGKLDLADTGITITQDDPYEVIIVPKTGLIPTTLTLQITPL